MERMLPTGLSRRRFLQRSAGGAVAVSGMGWLMAACGGDEEGGGSAAGKAGVKWISPRGTLDVMDDYQLWVAIKQGYFEQLGLDVELIAGPQDPTATTKFVAQKQADMGYPSPGVLTSSIESGVPVYSIWGMMAGQTFDFSLPADSDITSVQQLEGKTISVASSGWKVIIDPILVEVGVDPESVKLVESGQQWSQIVSQGKADAGLAWEGLRAQLVGQGLDLKFLVGTEFSKAPSNVYAVRKADLDDEAKRDTHLRFLQGTVMGFEFAKANPRAAAQITYKALPTLAQTLEPQMALASMVELASLYGASNRAGNGWGYHDPGAWDEYLKTIADLGQTKRLMKGEEVYTNDLVEPANSGADVDKARKDAEAFTLNAEFEKTTVPSDVEL